MATAYLNRSLTNLRTEVNLRWPNRDKGSDGWIGDVDHQSRTSDHNPEPDGSVDALDLDVDGIDVEEVINAAIRHEATKYIIYNRRITSRNMPGGLGVWHPYTGSNPHTKHLHVSTRDSHENSNRPWLPTPTLGEDEMKNLMLAREAGTPAVFVGNGITRRHVQTEQHLEWLQYWIGKWGGDPTVHVFADRGSVAAVLGVLVTDDPTVVGLGTAK